MFLYHLIILAIIQGITEFLPISSSGHLVLGHAIMHGDIADISWKADDVVIDVAVHLGTLLSVLLYFRKDVRNMISGAANAIKGGPSSHDGSMAFYVIVASLPVIIAGLGLNILSPDWVRSVTVVAWATLIFGVILGIADHFCPKDKAIADLNFKSAMVIGCAQILALIPGTSRSGITMTAARALGFSRVAAAKFSLLLAIIAISGAATLSGIDLAQSGDVKLGLDALIAALLAFISGWVAVALMMKWLEKSSFMPFVIYRIVMGVGLLSFIYLI